MSREEKLLLVFFGLAGVAAWLWLSQSGQRIAQSAGSAVATGVQNIVNIADSTVSLLKSLEGFAANAYRDAKGWSIGYGHYMGTNPTIDTVTPDQAEALLSDDLATAASAVNGAVKMPLSQNQFDALVSFAYNVGVNAFSGSTLLRKLNAGDYAGAAQEFPRWNKSGGVVNNSLVARRATEQQLFMTG